MTHRRLRRDTRGSTTVEFAVVGLMLCLVTLAVVETGLLWWMRTGLQITASMTARCGAIGYTYATSTCTTAATTQNFAVATARSWVFANAVKASGVTVNGRVATCNGFAGSFFSVSVMSDFFTKTLPLPRPLDKYATLSTNACYPMP